MTNLRLKLESFLLTHCDFAKPVLIALSGGPDSLCLLHLLIELQKKFPLQLGIAHVNHNWRSESTLEADQLRKMAEQFQIPFHLKDLLIDDTTNLEEKCRVERYQFFSSLCQQYGYQAVFLGHHADDQSETVLKRVFEGSHLCNFAGLQEKSEMMGIKLWRPLLKISKAKILQWISEKKLIPFDDYTNRDAKYLRSRMRSEILPTLSDSFGKEITNNLCVLSEEASELKEYLQKILNPFLTQTKQGPFGTYLDLSQNCPEDLFALKFVMRQFLLGMKKEIARSTIERAAQSIIENKADCFVPLGKEALYIDRKRIFLSKEFEAVSGMHQLELGISSCGEWQVEVSRENQNRENITGWEEVWNGFLEIYVPEDNYQIGAVQLSCGSISKWWTNEKVPAIFRKLVPVIWKDEKIYFEFLTKRSLHKPTEGPFFKIQLSKK